MENLIGFLKNLFKGVDLNVNEGEMSCPECKGMGSFDAFAICKPCEGLGKIKKSEYHNIF